MQERRERLRREITSGQGTYNRPPTTLDEAEALFPGHRVVVDYAARCDVRLSREQEATLLVSPDIYCEWRRQALRRGVD